MVAVVIQMSVINSNVFGPLRYSQAEREFIATVDNRGVTVTIEFACEHKSYINTLLPFAEKIWRRRAAIFKKYREHITCELLEILNGCLDCGEDDPPQLSRAELSRIVAKPTEMTFFLDGNEYDTLAFAVSGSYHPQLHRHTFCVFFDEDLSITDGEVVPLY